MYNAITKNEQLCAEEITDIIYHYFKYHDIDTGDIYGEFEEALNHIKTLAQNPFNPDYFRTLLDGLSLLAEQIRNNKYHM